MKRFFSKNNQTILSVILISFSVGAMVSFTIVRPAFTKDMIKNAVSIAGLNFDEKEIELLQDDLEDQVKTFQKNWESNLPNHVSPALVFNPLPQGFRLNTSQTPVQFDDYSNTEMPTSLNDLAYYSIGQLAHLIKTQQITSVDLTNFFLQRLKKENTRLHCVITFTEELAMQQARQADKEIKAGKYRGLLHGIPYGAKDLLAVKNYKTTWGAVPFKDQIIDYDATVIQKLNEAGAVLIAKLSMGALAWGDVWFGGQTRNPWNIKTGSSGSSAGSASAVAAGLVPFAIGTETLGSIVSPSTICGTTGLRPTFGRVSKYGAMALSWSMDKIGPIARTVEDCSIVFDAIRGKDEKDASTIEAAFNYDTNFDWKKLRVGYVKKDFEQTYSFHNQDSIALKNLQAMGIELIPIELPETKDITFILEAEAAAAFDQLTRSNLDSTMVRQIRNAWPNVFRKARLIPAVEYINANRHRTQLIEDMAKVMKDIDVYVHPSWASSSLGTTNLTGHPCVVLPNGFNSNGMPSSITFTGQLFGESTLLSIAKAYQDKTQHHLKHPELY